MNETTVTTVSPYADLVFAHVLRPDALSRHFVRWRRLSVFLIVAWAILRVADFVAGPQLDLMVAPAVLVFGTVGWILALVGVGLVTALTASAVRTLRVKHPASLYWIGTSVVLVVLALTFQGYRLAAIGAVGALTGLDRTAVHAFFLVSQYTPRMPFLPVSLFGAWAWQTIPAIPSPGFDPHVAQFVVVGATLLAAIILVFVKGTGFWTPLFAVGLGIVGLAVVYGSYAGDQKVTVAQSLLPGMAMLIWLSLLEKLRRKALNVEDTVSGLPQKNAGFLLLLVFLLVPAFADVHNNFSTAIAAQRGGSSSATATTRGATRATAATQPSNRGAPVRHGVVTAELLNVRAGPGQTFLPVDQLPHGTSVDVLETNNGWGRIGDNRWVSLHYVDTR